MLLSHIVTKIVIYIYIYNEQVGFITEMQSSLYINKSNNVLSQLNFYLNICRHIT